MKCSLQLVVGLGLLTTILAPAANAQTTNAPAANGPQAKPAPSAAPPVIEEQALSLLKQNQQAMFALKMYYAECHMRKTQDKPSVRHPEGVYELTTLTAEKPNKMRYEVWELNATTDFVDWKQPDSAPVVVTVCDGKMQYEQYDKVYLKNDRVKPENMHTDAEPWGGFFTPVGSPYGLAMEERKQNHLRAVQLAGSEAVEGIPCSKVFTHVISSYGGQKYENTTTWYFGPDKLARRIVRHVAFDDKPGVNYDATLTNIRLNEPVNAALYAYTPPQGVILEQQAKSPPVMANGTNPLDFTATDMSNNPVKLSDLRGKVVVIDFWASWCGPCNAAMPHNQAVMKKLKAEGLPVVMLAVDNAEGRADFEAWVKQKQASLSALTFVYISPTENVSGKKFKVTGIPTQFVLDKNGVIRASFVGFGGPTDDLEESRSRRARQEWNHKGGDIRRQKVVSNLKANKESMEHEYI